ncbi:MAG: hypothetical protein HY288_01965 [Planctomycetia bacterium]|nr:hypothetical protein [Planctomycetia bacterium]
MKKAEMEDHHRQYDALISQARDAEQGGMYQKAIKLALSSWQYIDGMMQYERKYADRESVDIEGIDIVLSYAPLLFDFVSLDKLESLLKSQRRIEKNASGDLAINLSKARTLMWDAHRLWEYLEHNSESRQDDLYHDLGGDHERWQGIAAVWESVGILCRSPDGGSHRLALYTQMNESALGKCSNCGTVGKAPKAKFLVEINCPKCRTRTFFIILARQPEKPA